jgi:hypothetical protein
MILVGCTINSTTKNVENTIIYGARRTSDAHLAYHRAKIWFTSKTADFGGEETHC